MAQRIAKDAADDSGDGPHRDGEQRRRSHIGSLDRAGNGDQRQFAVKAHVSH